MHSCHAARLIEHAWLWSAHFYYRQALIVFQLQCGVAALLLDSALAGAGAHSHRLCCCALAAGVVSRRPRTTVRATAENGQFAFEEGAAVKVKEPIIVYHVPKYPEVQLQGLTGTVKKIAALHKGAVLSANLQYRVQFEANLEGSNVKFFAHLVSASCIGRPMHVSPSCGVEGDSPVMHMGSAIDHSSSPSQHGAAHVSIQPSGRVATECLHQKPRQLSLPAACSLLGNWGHMEAGPNTLAAPHEACPLLLAQCMHLQYTCHDCTAPWCTGVAMVTTTTHFST